MSPDSSALAWPGLEQAAGLEPEGLAGGVVGLGGLGDVGGWGCQLPLFHLQASFLSSWLLCSDPELGWGQWMEV